MYVVVVEFEVRPDQLAEFLTAAARQAANSLKHESGCVQFDVCQEADNPSMVLLYEVYRSEAHFSAHLGSAHFLQFDAAVSKHYLRKQVRRFSRLGSSP